MILIKMYSKITSFQTLNFCTIYKTVQILENRTKIGKKPYNFIEYRGKLFAVILQFLIKIYDIFAVL